VFNGPEPTIEVLDSEQAEIEAVSAWLRERVAQGLAPDEIALFVRSPAQLPRARAAVQSADLRSVVLDERVETSPGHIAISTMHLAKGLEFRAVAVMACDDGIVPLEERIESLGDDADLEDVYNTERQLLYVACTRARDQLLVTGVEPASEFLDDMRG
jgi:superfamily I DNA/RNA helicase